MRAHDDHSPEPDSPSAVRYEGQVGVYVHYPRCKNACGYCDFPKVRRDVFPERRYADAVLGELVARRETFADAPGGLRSVFVGGGTPSLWPAGELGRVIAGATGAFAPADEVEVTVEANPETLKSPVTAEALLGVGVNRLSVGIQSLDDDVLRVLDRNHDAATARRAIAHARRAGFDNISCDLIFGVGGQTVDEHLVQLERLLELEPSHVSTYALTLEPSVALSRRGHRPAPDDRVAEMMERGRGLLETAGLWQYEVSNYARPGRESAHNALVWAGQPYLGLGAWAHSMATLPGGESLRVANPGLDGYLGAPLQGEPPVVRGAMVERCDADRSKHESLMLGLRTSQGVDRGAYGRRFGADPLVDRYAKVLEFYVDCKMLRIDEGWIAPTRRGIWFADELALALLSA